MSTTAPNAGVFAFPTSAHHPAASPERTKPVTETPTEPAIDHGLEESFPASDPVSVSVSKAVHPASHGSQGLRDAAPARRSWRSAVPKAVGAGVLAGGAALAVGYALTKLRRVH